MKNIYLIIGIVILLSLSSASAYYKDFSKIGEQKYGTITMKESALGSTLFEMELTDNSDTCIFYCYAEGRITFNQNLKFLDEVNFKLKTGKDWVNSETWHQLLIKKQGAEKWEIYEGEILKAGTYDWRLEGIKQPGETIDWIGTWGGIDFEEWALWTDGSLIAYWNMSSRNSTINSSSYNLTASSEFALCVGCVSPTFQTGKIGLGSNFTSGGWQILDNTDEIFLNNTGQEFSMSWWVNHTNVADSQCYFSTRDPEGYYIEYNNPTANRINIRGMNALNLTSTSAMAIDTWNHVVLTKNSSHLCIFVNNVMENCTLATGKVMNPNTNFSIGQDGMTGAFTVHGLMDEVGIWARSLTIAEVNELYNGGDGLTYSVSSTTLNSPADNSKFLAIDTITFNATGENSALHNASLFIDGLLNQTITTVTGTIDEIIFTETGFSEATHNWTIRSCGTDGCFYGTNRTFNTTTLLFLFQNFNNQTIEGSTETFEVNLTYDSLSYLNIIGNLIYNGTSYTGTKINTGNNISFIRNLQIPSIDTEVNITFYWQILLLNSSTSEFNSTDNNQTVKNINIDICGAYTILLLNYTIYDEETLTMLDGSGDNTTIEVDLDIFPLGSTTSIVNLSNTYLETNPAQVCLQEDLLNGTQYQMNVETRYSSTNRTIEYHNIQNFTLENSTLPQHIALYDLLLVDSQEFGITFKDTNFIPVEDALIDIQRKYIGDGIFRSVEIPRTDEFGQTKGHFDLDGVIYTIVVSKNGKVLATFDNIAVVCQEQILENCELNLNALSTGVPFEDLTQLGGITYTFDFDRDAQTITVIFSTTDGSSRTVLLNTTKYDMFGNNTVCFDTLTSSSGTLTCNIPDVYGNSTVVSRLYVNGDLITTRTFYMNPSSSDMFGTDNLVIALILIITIPLMLIPSPITFMIGIFLGLIMAGALLLTSGSVLGTGSAIMWAIIAGGIIIWKIANRETG